MPIDGKVTGLNRPVFEALQKVKNPNEMTVDEAKSLRAAILKDGKIDASELDLLQELSQDNNKVKVSAAAEAGLAPVDILASSAKGAAKDKLSILATPPNMNALWDSGAEGMRKLTDLSTISPAFKERVAQFVSFKLEAAWEASSLTNAYAPMVSTVGGAFNAIRNDAESNGPGRELLLSGFDKVNQRLAAAGKAPIQPFLYEWLRPGGVI